MSPSANVLALVLFSIISLCYADSNKCSNFINNEVCSKSNNVPKGNGCTAQYEGFFEIEPKIRQFINSHIIASYQYLLMATSFSNHKMNRPGFEGLYRKMSDEVWEDAIELIKYNAKRGGRIENFNDFKDTNLKAMLHGQRTTMYEYNSLAKALDIQKELASGAHDIHKDATRLGNVYHDAEISSFIEKQFVHKHADSIRDFSGLISDLNGIMVEYQEQTSLPLYMFDEYLQSRKSVV